MNSPEDLYRELAFLGKEAVDELIEKSEFAELPGEAVILEEGQNVRWLPIVLKGRIRVFTRHEEKELLLYYILPHESCIMSFTAAIHQGPSRIHAITECDTELLLIPARYIRELTEKYAPLREMIYNLYQVRYEDLLDTIRQVVFYHLDERILAFLREEAALNGQDIIRLSHREIAHKLGTAREVVSRVLKKLENEELIEQSKSGIRLTGL